MKKLIFFIVVVSMANFTVAQERISKLFIVQQKSNPKKSKSKQLLRQNEEDINLYKKQIAVGFKFNTDGFSAFLEKGKIKTPTRSRLFSFEFGERKHPKEEKIKPAGLSTLPNRYVFGKINNFYYAKLMYAQQRVVGNKGSKNGVEVSAIYGAGLVAGLMKPYYLKIRTARIIEDIKYNNNDDVFINNPQQVYGATGFTKGLTEIKVTPGATAKAALRFDYGRYYKVVSALEIGVNTEVYTKKMQQMLLVKNHQFFFNGYVALMFGGRK